MINVQVKGLRELEANLKAVDSKIKLEVKATVENGAKVFVRNAKRDAPVNFGVLRNEITYIPTSSGNKFSVQIVSGAKYSYAMEWGTITKVNVPGELQGYASRFKGKGIRKNGGIFPRPFFFKQVPVAKLNIEKGIEAIIKSIK